MTVRGSEVLPVDYGISDDRRTEITIVMRELSVMQMLLMLLFQRGESDAGRQTGSDRNVGGDVEKLVGTFSERRVRDVARVARRREELLLLLLLQLI